MSKKQLILLRHAKSSWEDDQLVDHDRPLNDRGRKAAKRIGRLLLEQRIVADVVLCSTSVRTRETAKIVFSKWPERPEIWFRSDLYHASPEQMAVILAGLADQQGSAMLIGHNPGFEQFLEQLTGQFVKFPTAAVAVLELDLEAWDQVSTATRGRLVQLWKPKELTND